MQLTIGSSLCYIGTRKENMVAASNAAGLRVPDGKQTKTYRQACGYDRPDVSFCRKGTIK